MLLKQGERLDDLQFNNLFLIQHPQEYCFNSDSVELANFVKCPKNANVVDLCSGSGVIGILVNAKNNCKSITFVELQKHFADMCRRSCEYNKLTNTQVINARIQDICKQIGTELFDVVVCNPPYKTEKKGLLNEKETVALARHEIAVTLEEIVQEASKLLKFGGKFYTVNKEERLTDLLVLMRKYNLEPKVLKVLPSKKGASVVMIEGKKGGKSGIRISL